MLGRMFWLLAGVSALVVVIAAGSSGAASIPSGQRTLAQNVLEPVYNDENAGQIGYIMQPEHTAQPVPSNPAAWAPFYLVIYPVGSTAATTYLCMHLPVDNCPTHGPGVAAFAQATYPTVYGAGVIGHDHLMDFPGASDFNIAWEPMFVLFTPKAPPTVPPTGTSSLTRKSTRWLRAATRRCSRAQPGPSYVPPCRGGSTTWQRRLFRKTIEA